MLPIKHSLKHATAIIIGIIASIIIAETCLRLAGYHYNPLTIKRTDAVLKDVTNSDWRPYHQTQDLYSEIDPELIWRPKKNFKGIFNAQRLRGRELPPVKPADAFYIFTLGDSNTLGGYDYPSWVEYLAEILKKNDPNVYVENAGVWGYTSFQGLLRLKKILPLKPDMILISFGCNDAHRVFISDKNYISSKKLFSSTIMRLGIA